MREKVSLHAVAREAELAKVKAQAGEAKATRRYEDYRDRAQADSGEAWSRVAKLEQQLTETTLYAQDIKKRRNDDAVARRKAEGTSEAAAEELADTEELLEQTRNEARRLQKLVNDTETALRRAEKKAEKRSETAMAQSELAKVAKAKEGELTKLMARVETEAARDVAAAQMQAAEAQEAAKECERTVARLTSKVVSLQEQSKLQRSFAPLAARKQSDQLSVSQTNRRRLEARKRLGEALQQNDLRMSDIANELQRRGKVDGVMNTKVFWSCKMDFARELNETLSSAWSADLSVDVRDQYGLSERIMDGIRYDMSHEVVNGRVRPRVLVDNPFNKRDKVHFPQPVRPRCAWRRRMREREEAMELLKYDEDQTCERDFSKTLNGLIERDESLLRDNFSASRPFTPVIGFDGADNFCHGTLRLTDYKDGVAEESELKAKQLFVAMGDDHYPRLERTIALRIGPAASALTSVSIGGRPVPAEAALCLDLSAARSAYGRRAGKNAHTTETDVHRVLELPKDCAAKRAFDLLGSFAPWLKVESLRADAHAPRRFPFKCTRPGCGVTIKDSVELDRLKAELAALKANKTVAGKKAYAKAVALHADSHNQQMPFEAPVTDIPVPSNILDLLHALDLNLLKVGMKYSVLDPVVLDDDIRLQIGDFLSEIGCSLDVRNKENRDPNRKWFHGSVWHYDFVRGANKKSYGLHVNIFQLCLIVYGVQQQPPPTARGTATAPKSKQTPVKAKEGPTAIVDDWSDEDDEPEDEGAGEEEAGEADLSTTDVMAELRGYFGANAEKVKSILEMWNAYADLYNACCDEWTSDSDAYREDRAFKLLKSGLNFHGKLNDVSNQRHKCWYAHKIWAVGSRQMLQRGDLWRFSTRAVEGRGGRLKHIGRRMICWRRRSGRYLRNVRGKVVAQTYSSAPERQLMRASCAREDRAHTQSRSRMATTGRNTLKRTFDKVEVDAMPSLGGEEVGLEYIKRCVVARV